MAAESPEDPVRTEEPGPETEAVPDTEPGAPDEEAPEEAPSDQSDKQDDDGSEHS